MTACDVLVVAGEASGDRIAALACAPLAARGCSLWGIGGPACRAAGVELLDDGSRLAAMGIGDVVRSLPALAASLARLHARVARTPPRAALLVNFTELNQHLGRYLRRHGVRVLWCVAPQVWAWRPERLRTLRGACDRLAVILPFEEKLWRDAGFDAHYVGHPSRDIPRPSRAEVRARLGMPSDVRAVAVLPGSRAGEIRRLAAPLLDAAAMLRREGSARAVYALLAPGLDPPAASLAQAEARRAGIEVVEGDAAHGAASLLGAFDLALTASGTASLEAALAGTAPVVAYRLDPLSYAVARRLVRTPHIALPNVLLGRRAFPELVQGEVTAERVAAAGREMLRRGREDAAARAEELRGLLAVREGGRFGERVAGVMEGWVGG